MLTGGELVGAVGGGGVAYVAREDCARAAAAALARVSIVSYEATTFLLRVPMHAPLPEPCARLACISSGNVGAIDDGAVLYSPVPPRVAGLILASLGQSFT